jgi:hypothetical protein
VIIMSTPPPQVECQRCASQIKITDRILSPETSERVCKSCATEEELEAWQEYCDEMMARAEAAEEKDPFQR